MAIGDEGEGLAAPQIAFKLARTPQEPGLAGSFSTEEVPTLVAFAPALSPQAGEQGREGASEYVPGLESDFLAELGLTPRGPQPREARRRKELLAERRKRQQGLPPSLAYALWGLLLLAAALGLALATLPQGRELLSPFFAGEAEREKRIAKKARVQPAPTFKVAKPAPEPSVGLPDKLVPSLPAATPAITYHNLPNVLSVPASGQRVWTAQEEEHWRKALAHKFWWQHYKTVQEIKAKRLLQSQVLLWAAIHAPSFWTRMYALMGLAEFGVPVAAELIGRACKKESDALVSNFFKRFYHKSSAGERFVMRQALEKVGPRARFHLLRILAQTKNPEEASLVGLYLVTALHDPSSLVRGEARKLMQRFSPEQRAYFKAQVRAYASAPAPRSESFEPALSEQPKAPQS